MKYIKQNKAENKGQHIIYYDAQCPVCQKLMHSVEKHDQQKLFEFTPLQLSKYKDSPYLIYEENGKHYKKSDAAIKIAQKAGMFKPLIFLSKLFPGIIKDAIYDLVAKHRHKIRL